jgi:hypothetical protein
MRKLVNVIGIWRLSFFGNQERHVYGVCNNVSYTFKEFISHKDTHTFKEHDEALHKMIKDDLYIRRHCNLETAI